jgi:hypothetical protein
MENLGETSEMWRPGGWVLGNPRISGRPQKSGRGPKRIWVRPRDLSTLVLHSGESASPDATLLPRAETTWTPTTC